MNTFKIGNTEFGIGDIRLSVADNVLNLEMDGEVFPLEINAEIIVSKNT